MNTIIEGMLLGSVIFALGTAFGHEVCRSARVGKAIFKLPKINFGKKQDVHGRQYRL